MYLPGLFQEGKKKSILENREPALVPLLHCSSALPQTFISYSEKQSSGGNWKPPPYSALNFSAPSSWIPSEADSERVRGYGVDLGGDLRKPGSQEASGGGVGKHEKDGKDPRFGRASEKCVAGGNWASISQVLWKNTQGSPHSGSHLRQIQKPWYWHPLIHSRRTLL